jgi:DNA repair protein RecN (Recombination protein N)
LKQYLQQLKLLSGFHKEILTIQERFQATIIELDDIGSELEHLNENIRLDTDRMEQINEQLHQGYKLLKKHNVTTTEALIRIKSDLESIMHRHEDTDGTIKEKEKSAASLEAEANRLAGVLHEKRVAVSKSFAKNINTILHQVGMPNARIKISVESVSLNEFGSSAIEFLFDANRSDQFEPIRKVASGGELSRLMLCIKSLVADSMQLPVLIFDEIDTGISGEAARQVGILLNSLSKSHQVICITHQAQIAAKAHTHFFVYKQIEKNQVRTGISILSTEERITTIAQMLSGEKPTAAALQNAREMVNN